MLWDDERYVRLFTRDTIDWLAWPWQSRALLPLLMRKCSRAGKLDMGKHGAAGLAALVNLPPEVVDPGLAGLLADGCLCQTGTVITLRNFINAQESKTGDAERKRKQRERDRDLGLDLVTPRDDESQNVTKSHKVSQPVTPSHKRSRLAVLSRTEPNRTEPTQTDPEEAKDLQLAANNAASRSSVPEPSLASLEQEWDQDLLAQVKHAFASTRKFGKIANTVWRTFLVQAKPFSKVRREAAATLYLDRGYSTAGKKAEKYLLGMMRGGAGLEEPTQPRLPHENRVAGHQRRPNEPIPPSSREEHIAEQEREDAERRRQAENPEGET